MSKQPEEQFQIKGTDAEATGYPAEDGFIVNAGGIARKEIVPSAIETLSPIRKQLLSDGVLEPQDGQYRFTTDHRFNSPSAAAAAVLGRTSNGWLDWKHSDGRSLSEVKRITRDSNDAIFSETKRQQILFTHEKMLNEGLSYPEDQLNMFYETFQQKFSPDALANLEGEDLLNFMHDHGNHDSLVYWLEFKHDDVFDTKRFGSIAGGSALKFRVFRRKETGIWQASSGSYKPKTISTAEAIGYAEAHRDQLTQGCKLLEQLSGDASDDDYAELQDRMDEVAPDFSSLAWGHKYFSLLFPDKIDDFHSPHWQRFHLLKMLQIPPDGNGRYISAGRFVAAAKEVNLPIHHLTSILNVLHGNLHRYWRVGTRDGGAQTSHWAMMRDRVCVAIGWPKLGDLSWVEAKVATKAKLKELIHEKHPTNPQAEGQATSQITHFTDNISEGDVVWAADGAKILGIGRVTGPYRYEPAFEFPHQRSVEWLDLEEWTMPVHEGLRSTVREIKKHSENIVETERRIQNAVVTEKRVSSAPTINRNLRLPGISGRIQSVLNRKSQVILYGPPGTGKTYWAESAARNLAAVSAFGKLIEDLSETQKRVIDGDESSAGIVRMCCFHPAYGYEDFLEGYRPRTVNGQVAFDLRDGVFKQLCRDAVESPEQKFYLIVDEINRGDIPRIFGELLTTLEKDKRGKRIVLPVSQEVFTVPQNVFLIGTMNTADRSISLLDAALRRRFGFIEMMPDGSVLANAEIAGVPLRAWFNALNERIREHVGRDARNLQIGHSYLMQAGKALRDMASLKRAIRDDIIPLLEEYCYEDYATLGLILGDELVDVQRQRIQHHLFDDGQEDNLVQALMSLSPDISTSSEALSSDESLHDKEANDDDSDEDDIDDSDGSDES